MILKDVEKSEMLSGYCHDFFGSDSLKLWKGVKNGGKFL